MSTVTIDDNFIDHDRGAAVRVILEKYMSGPLSEETCDLVMEDVRTSFGENIDAQVMIDTDTGEIEIVVRDKNDRFMKCTSLSLPNPIN